MNNSKKYDMSDHTTAARTVLMNTNIFGKPVVILFTVLFLFNLPAYEAKTACSFNGNGSCSVSTDTDKITELLNNNDSTVIWKIRPQNIGFMYYLRTTDNGDDLGVRGIVKWKVQLKNWTPNDTVVEGFLVTILEHDTNETVTSYEVTITEPIEQFSKRSDVLEMRLELDDVLRFDKKYDAKINILPIGKQAAASSFLAIMGKLEGEKCSAMTGLAERWAPHVMVNLFETTSDIQLSWQAAPQFLCIKTYEVILQSREGVIINTTEVDVNFGQKFANTTFHGIERNLLVQVKVRGKSAVDGGCACVNCNCITDKTKYFMIPNITKTQTFTSSPTTPIHHNSSKFPEVNIYIATFGFFVLLFFSLFSCFCCQKYRKIVFKKNLAFSALKSSQHLNRKTRQKKFYKIMLVCPELSGRDHDYMMRIANALKKSKNSVVFDRWRENSKEAEENMLQWVYEQTRIAEIIMVFHSSTYHPRCGVYDIINNFFPCTDPRLVHVALNLDAQRNVPKEVEYVLPRDQKPLEEAYDITIADPLVIDIPIDDNSIHENASVHKDSFERIIHEQQNSSKAHSTDSGFSSMPSNSSDSEGVTDTIPSDLVSHLKDLNVESHPLLCKTIPVL